VAVSVKTYATGMLKDIIDLSGTVKMLASPTGRCSGWYGARQGPGQSRIAKLEVLSDGTSVVWNDYSTNTQFTSLATSPTDGIGEHVRELILQDWSSATPFTMELTQFPNLTKTRDQQRQRRVCDVVEAMPAPKDRNRTWWHQREGPPAPLARAGTGTRQKISKVCEISDLKIEKYTARTLSGALERLRQEGHASDPAAAEDHAPHRPRARHGPRHPRPAFTAKDTSRQGL